MPIISIIEKIPSAADKEAMAEAIAKQLIHENPLIAQLNASTLRTYIFKMMGYNEFPSKIYAKCLASSFSMPVGETKLSCTVDKDGQVLRVCPSCKHTMEIGDPICANCSRVFPDHDIEASIVAKAIRKVSDAKLEASRRGSALVLNDEVEGIKITERDVDKYLRDIEKYIP